MNKTELKKALEKAIKAIKAGQDIEGIEGIESIEGDYIINKTYTGRITKAEILKDFNAKEYYKSHKAINGIWIYKDDNIFTVYARVYINCKYVAYNEETDIQILKLEF